MPLQLLFNECVCLKYASPAVSLVLGVDILLLAEYFFRERHKKVLYKGTYFFKTAFIAYLVSYGLSMIFSIVPFTEVMLNTIKYFIQTFLIVFLFQKALNDGKDVKLFLKATFVVAVLVVALGLYEVINKDNPVLDFVFVNAPLEAIKGKMYYTPPFISYTGELNERFGAVRAYSFFGIHIAFGCTCVLLFFLYMYLWKKNILVLSNKIMMAGMLLFITGVMLSNSKTPLVGLLFFVFGMLTLRDILNFKVIAGISIVVIVIVIFSPNYLNNFIALFDSGMAEKGGGSSTAMRATQFDVGLRLFSMNPIFGNGVGSIAVLMKNPANADLLGSESSWLKILPERGIVGVIAYLILYCKMFKQLVNIADKKKVFFFLGGLLAMETATGFMDFALYGSIVICIYRIHQLLLKESENKKSIIAET